MFHQAFDPFFICDRKTVTVSDIRNFIAPNFHAGFWTSAVFDPKLETTERRLEALRARHKAAEAALYNLGLKSAAVPDELDRRLRPLEEQVASIADALAELERAAADDTGRRSPEDGGLGPTGTADRDGSDGHGEAREVQIAKNDSPLRYDTNLSVDLLTMVYAGRGVSGSSGVLFGVWYRSMQDGLIAERPTATRGMDYRDNRMSRTFVSTVVLSLQSCGRLYVGSRHYSAFECAVLCLHLAHRSSARSTTAAAATEPVSFAGLLERLPAYLEGFADTIGVDGGRARYLYDTDRLPKGQFSAPTGGRYDRGALGGHSVLSALVKLRVMPLPPGAVPREGPSREADGEQSAYVDEVNRAASAFFGRAQNLFLMEDQTLLRATVNTITALLLLRRLLRNGNVYADRMRNNFQLGALIPGGAREDGLVRGAAGFLPRDAVRSEDNNLSFLCKHYVVPLYRSDNSVEVTQLFPGLAAICLDAQRPMNQREAGVRRVLDVSNGRYQAGLLRLVALELENRSRVFTTSIQEVIHTHDAVTLQYERGLGLLMQQPRVRSSLDENLRLTQFNVSSDYDLLYFLCLGFIPLFASSA